MSKPHKIQHLNNKKKTHIWKLFYFNIQIYLKHRTYIVWDRKAHSLTYSLARRSRNRDPLRGLSLK